MLALRLLGEALEVNAGCVAGAAEQPRRRVRDNRHHRQRGIVEPGEITGLGERALGVAGAVDRDKDPVEHVGFAYPLEPVIDARPMGP